MSMTQAAFVFEGAKPVFAREDFLVSDANREALAWVDRWPEWPAFGMVLSGPHASGKTHLAYLWANETAARFIAPEVVGVEAPEDVFPLGAGASSPPRIEPHAPHAFSAAAPPSRGSGASSLPTAVLDGLEQVGDAQEEGLFHLLNHVKAGGGSLLLTSRLPLAELNIRLPDLRSRLAALPVASLAPPDDVLLSALFAKQFSDRQLRVGDEVIAWLLPRMERSFAQVREVVERIDRAALQGGRAVTVPFVRALLAEEDGV